MFQWHCKATHMHKIVCTTLTSCLSLVTTHLWHINFCMSHQKFDLTSDQQHLFNFTLLIQLLHFWSFRYLIHRSSGQPAGTTLLKSPATGPGMPQASCKAILHAVAASCGLAQREQALSLNFCLHCLPVNVISILYGYNSRIRRFLRIHCTLCIILCWCMYYIQCRPIPTNRTPACLTCKPFNPPSWHNSIWQKKDALLDSLRSAGHLDAVSWVPPAQALQVQQCQHWRLIWCHWWRQSINNAIDKP